jgi:four helix bundle protein
MSEPSLNRKFMEMMKLLNVYLNHFPAHEKYALSNQIRKTAYELYDFISEGQKRYYKKTTLTNLDINHEKLRMQIYLAYELGYFNFKDGRKSKKKVEERRYSAISRQVDELGKMIGGWIKKIKEQNQWK